MRVRESNIIYVFLILCGIFQWRHDVLKIIRDDELYLEICSRMSIMWFDVKNPFTLSYEFLMRLYVPPKYIC